MCPVKQQDAVEHEIFYHPAHRPLTVPIKILGCCRQDLINMRGTDGARGYRKPHNEWLILCQIVCDGRSGSMHSNNNKFLQICHQETQKAGTK
jgi:hypothetical protein